MIDPQKLIGWTVDVRDTDAELGGIVVLPDLTVVASDYTTTTLADVNGTRYTAPYGEMYSDEASNYHPYVLQQDVTEL